MAYHITDSADIGSKGLSRVGNSAVGGIVNSTRTVPSSEMPKQGKQVPALHGNSLLPQSSHLALDKNVGSLSFCLHYAGIPDFAEVYSFIGSVFDPDTKGHVQKLKEMDPINFETVSLINTLLSDLIVYAIGTLHKMPLSHMLLCESNLDNCQVTAKIT